MTLGANMIDEALLRILVCPGRSGSAAAAGRRGRTAAVQPRLRRAYRIEDSIPVLLVDEAVEVGDDEHAQLMAQARPANPQ